MTASNARVAGREHIPLYPKGFIALRIVQLVLALFVLALASYGVSLLAFDGDIFIMVVALFTMIITIYYIVAEFGAPGIYNYWAVLGLDIFLIVMWLASFALLASEVAAVLKVETYYDYYTGGYYSSNGLGTIAKGWADCLAAASGIGGLQFALFVASLVIHSLALHRHRAAGLHCTPGAPATAPTTGAELKQPEPTYTSVPPQQYAVPQYAAQTPQPQPQQVYAVPAAGYPTQQYPATHQPQQQQA